MGQEGNEIKLDLLNYKLNFLVRSSKSIKSEEPYTVRTNKCISKFRNNRNNISAKSKNAQQNCICEESSCPDCALHACINNSVSANLISTLIDCA